MTAIQIEYQDKQVRQGLRRLLHAGTDMSPVMRKVAAHLEKSAKDSFSKQTAPEGAPWEKLKPSTIKQRQKSGHVPIKLLQQNAVLLGSIKSDFDKTSAVAGTNLKYARTHQFGAHKGAFGQTKRGTPLPWGDIPARPFLGVSSSAEAQIRNDIIAFISARWQ